MSPIDKTPTIHVTQQALQDKYKYIPKGYMDIAQGMEKQFTNHLLAQMRKTVDSVEPDSQAKKIYKSMLDDERAQLMAESSTGLGVKDLILDQLYPKYRRVPPNQAVQMYNPSDSHKGVRNE